MKRSTLLIAALAITVTGSTAGIQLAHAEDAPGLALFKKNGCNECHAISALSIEKDAKKKAADPAAAPAESETKKKKEPPDLSGVGLEHEAKWISAFLNKEETLDGEKHEKRFKGTEAERRTIAMWLGSLKTEVKKAPADAKPGGESEKGETKGDGK